MTALQAVRNISRLTLRVWRRDLDVYLTTWKTNFLPPLLEPVFYVLAFGLGIGSLIGDLVYQGVTVSYLRFMAPGVLAVAIMFWSFFENTYASFVRMYYQRTFDAMMATPLLVEDVIAGEILWGTTKSLLASVIMLGVLTGFGLVAYPTGLWVVPLAVLGGLLFASLGMICTAVTPNIDTFNFPIFVFVFPMFMFSGTFFPIDILPEWARILAWILPLTHVSLLVRGSTLGWYPDGAVWSLLYLTLVTAAAFLVALLLMKRRLVK
ncbi:MAG: ABC transporter permease [Candidatus Eisenbacteria bacterium]|nr:ABC transporter permease [Candidatus Latescibacterota bacterium]MBD3300956.1 ABC transporter permease [Candidatus Eisenbacteria bacterium]